MKFRRIAYRSLRAPGLSDDALLTEIVLPAAERNRREGITGCLSCGTQAFVQIIEGPPDAVHALMSRIVDDPRHHSLTMLMNVSARMRIFETWSLKWVRGDVCTRVEGLAEAIVSRAPRPAVPETAATFGPPDLGVAASLRPAQLPSRMSLIVNSLIGAEPESSASLKPG
ncbi:MAG TPA: BLUF domain-containing protein [Phycisphaerales bacterium]|nr:BLUF domain-containing protein [Phycisphaerales bacterium]